MMAARNMKSAPTAKALAKTFDGHHPCGLCLKIQKPLPAPSHNIAAPSAGPIDALFLAGYPLLADIMAFDLTMVAPRPVQQRAARVATPPPRFLPA